MRKHLIRGDENRARGWRSIRRRQTGYSQPIPKAGIGGSPRFAAHARRSVRAGFIIRPMAKNSFGAAANLRVGTADYHYFRLSQLTQQGIGDVGHLPFSIRILLENLLRNEDGPPAHYP